MKAVRQGCTMMATIAAVGALLALPALLVGCGAATGQEPASPSPSTAAPISERQVVDLVDVTCAAIETDAPGTLAAINAGKAPYVDPSNPALYAFVFDLDVSVAANPHPEMQGQSLKGKPDAAGKLFRDEIVAGALAKGSGWEQYVYAQPGTDGLQLKTTYYKLAHGSDGRQYVVGAGRYLGPWEGTPQPSPSASGAATQAQVQAFVEKAVAYARTHPKKQALAAFTAPGGEFHEGELYIYAYDYSGTVIAHGGDPKLVGKDLIGMTDPNGLPVIKNLVRLAKDGSGWLYFMWGNPLNDNRVEPKLGYVMKVDDSWFLGSGTYGPAAVKPPSKAQVKAFVDEAWTYANKVGRQQAIDVFMDKSGPFFRGELYVFADQFDGTVLCFPIEPQSVGKNLWDRRDPDGVYPVREMAAVAEDPGSGWASYKYANPAQGYQMQRKLSYVRRVDDTWFLGAGTYVPAE